MNLYYSFEYKQFSSTVHESSMLNIQQCISKNTGSLFRKGFSVIYHKAKTFALSIDFLKI